jgi:glutamyl-tRNA reductase
LLHLFGLNHKSAPIAVRENIVVDDIERIDVLDEIVTLSTCNRTELIAVTSDSGQVKEWLKSHNAANWEQYSYQYQNQEAIAHLLRVACGLDSMVLGEAQILGQLKGAYAAANENGKIGKYLGHLFPFVFSVAKKIRTETGISANSVSVAYNAVHLAKSIFSDLQEATVLLVGAGDTIHLVTQYLYDIPVKNIVIANRSLKHSQALAEQVGARAICIDDIPVVLPQADIIITATASPQPILEKALIESALKERRHKPMYMVDLAVPRDIDPAVGELDDVYLYNIDDIESVVETNLAHREKEAAKAEVIIQREVQKFFEWQNSLKSVPTICAYREKMQQFRDTEVLKAQKAYDAGKPVSDVLEQLANGLTNKLMHAPTVEMRKATKDGNSKVLEWAKQLFQLN